MTEDEVVKILGGPSLKYKEVAAESHRLKKELGRPPFEFQRPWLEEPEVPFRPPLALGRFRIWTGRRGSIEIELNQDNHVCWKRFQAVRWINGGILDRLPDWLGW